MLEIISFSIGIAFGVVICGLVIALQFKAKSDALILTAAQLEECRTSIRDKNANLENLEERLAQNGEDLLLKTATLSGLEERLIQERQNYDEKITLLMQAKESLTEQFKNLANDIFEEKGKRFTEKNKESLETILNPLKENIDGFKKKVEDTYLKETRERVVLKEELNKLAQLNARLGDEAESLTNALVGQNQSQGAWGEMILETLLEQSGLQKGIHYHTQHSGENSEGQRLRPDVVIRLPEGKDIIIDSKVSLTAYRKYCSATKPDEIKKHVIAHIRSMRTHVKELSDKNYYDLTDLNSLEYVLMFVPIEAAFSSAIENNQDLVTDALSNNVVIVTPTTLLLALRTIENIWRYEAQSQNAQEIATKAGYLYDKFVGFIDDIRDVGLQIGRASKAQEKAINKLSEGKGNLLNRAEELKKLGAKTNKSLPKPDLEK